MTNQELSKIHERFWSKVNVTGSQQACWEWIGKTNLDGYGMFKCDKTAIAPRVAYFLRNGEWPEVCRHTCDNKKCVNPNHLLSGTIADNTRDAFARGKIKKGVNHPRSIFKADDIKAIREKYSTGNFSYADLSAEYKCHKTVIGDIVTRKRYTDV